ncbi:MAG: hypothetical protein R2799_00555 [Crocinitomicaceae bacterium]
MKKLTLALVSLIAGLTLNAQNLMHQIPANSELVIQLGLDNLNQLYPTSKLFKLDMWKDAAKEMQTSSMETTGINFKKPAFLSVDFADTCSYFSFHFEIANSKQFYELIAKNRRDLESFRNYKNTNFTLVNLGRNQFLFIGNDYAVLTWAEMQKEFSDEKMDYFMEIYYEELRKYEYEYQQEDAIQGFLARERMVELLTNKGRSFDSTNCFQIFDETHEINVWFNQFFSQMSNFIYDREVLQLSRLFSILDAQAGFDFSMLKGKAEMEMRIEFSDEMGNEIQKMFQDRKLNQDFFKYIPEDRLFVQAMSINSGVYYHWVKRVFTESLGGTYLSKETMQDIMDLVSILLDEEAITNLVSGDFLFALNKIEKVEFEYKSNRYNDNFEMEEYTRTRTVEFPEFTMVLGIDNMRFFEKILSILIRENLVKEENGYFILPAGREFPSGVGIWIKEDRMIISNDFKMLNNLKLNTYYNSKETMAIKSVYSELHIHHLFDYLAQETTNYYDFVGFSFLKNTFKDLNFELSTDVNNKVRGHAQLEMMDTKTNAYVSLMNGLNEMFVKMELEKDKGKYEFYSSRLEALIKVYESIPEEKKSEEGDKLVQIVKEAIHSKESKDDPYILKSLIWKMEDAIRGDFNQLIDYEEK